MNIKQFEEFTRQVNYESIGTVAGGFIGTIPTTITLINNYINITPNVNPEMKKDIFEIAKPAFKEKKLALTKTLIVTLSGSNDKILNNYYEAAQILENAFRQVNAQPLDKCPICNQSGCDSAALYKNLYNTVHHGCMEQKCAQENDSLRSNAINGNYLSGMLGGFLGAVLSVLLCSVAIITVETMFTALYMLIPFAIYYGYKMLNGRMDKFVTIYTLVLSLIAAAACNYIPVIYILASNVGQGVPFSWVLRYAFSAEIFKLILEDLVFSYLFIIIGIVSTWRLINKTGISYIEDNHRILETMKPLSGRAYDNTFNNINR